MGNVISTRPDENDTDDVYGAEVFSIVYCEVLCNTSQQESEVWVACMPKEVNIITAVICLGMRKKIKEKNLEVSFFA